MSVLIKVNFVKQEHRTFIPEQTELDHDSLGLFTQLKDNIAQTVHVYSIALLFSVDKSSWQCSLVETTEDFESGGAGSIPA